jgi:hypothetical protein
MAFSSPQPVISRAHYLHASADYISSGFSFGALFPQTSMSSTRDMVFASHVLSHKLGPVIRIGPGMIDVQLSEVTIQGWGGQNKSNLPWDKEPELCKIFRANMPVDNIVSIASARESKRIRRLVGPPFAKKFLADQEEVFKNCTKRVFEKIDNLRIKNDNKVDMFQMFKEYALDVISI